MSDIINTMKISGAGMRVQSERVRVIAQNMANADTAPSKPGELPYTRKTITFKNQLDREIGEKLVQVDKIEQDKEADYVKKYMPGHPAADARRVPRHHRSGVVAVGGVHHPAQYQD